MSNYTYEERDVKTPLETYEWDNVWFEHTEIDTPDRVMYIGDSISCVTRKAATAASENKLLFDGFGTSKALDNAYFKESVRIFAAQQGKRRAIVFNNGLHGWHLDDSTEYAEYYESFVKFLLDELIHECIECFCRILQCGLRRIPKPILTLYLSHIASTVSITLGSACV